MLEQEINVDKIIQAYLKKRDYDTTRYHMKKNEPEYQEANRQRASKWYHDNREKKQGYYDDNKEFLKARSQYRYWQSVGKDLDAWREKYPERHELLVSKGFIPTD